MNQTYKNFDASEVELKNSNLIEASAGTGKTYSIAILVLRLILEKKILIQDILMVTFTNAAVAELEERIRRFVRNAYRYTQGEEITDNTIKKIVDKHNREEAIEILKLAVLHLDETSVMTIHGFCQQTLTEFAFETNQLFSAELITDDSVVLKEEVQKFWRKHITGIQTELLSLLIDEKLDLADIQSIVKSHISGKNYIYYSKNETYAFEHSKQLEFLKEIQNSELEVKKSEDEFIEYIQSHKNEIIEKLNANRNAQKSLLPLINQTEEFIAKIQEGIKKNTKYILELEELVIKISRLEFLRNEVVKRVEDARNYLYAFAIQEITSTVKLHLLSHNLLSYDDLIANLHKALTDKPNLRLEAELRKKYKAVFIDEFQDTDRQQYEIFKTAFQQESILFYIGDPKQSIYAWRKADIATYFEARNSVDKVYGMNTNYRSTTKMIAAMNDFFLPTDECDTFYFTQEKDRIDYIKVDAPKVDEKGQLMIENQECIPITVGVFKNKSQINAETARQVLDLLSNEKNTVYDKNIDSQRRIKPSDIGILVRTQGRAIEIKNELGKLRIPAVTNTGAKILISNEAMELVSILEAMLKPLRSNINRALKTIFINMKTQSVLKVDEEKSVQLFKSYNEIWMNKGIYASLMSFVNDFNVRDFLLSEKAMNGERILTNLYHLSEILYKVESRQRLNPTELTDWLKKSNVSNDGTEDEMEQRIESDENSVNIVTIHSSKGLQYNIVIAPDLDWVYNHKYDIVNLRRKDGTYITAKRNQLNEEEIELHKYQDEQENRRLLYVAITRAVYKCYIYKNDYGHFKNSTLSFFINQIQENEWIAFTEPVEPKVEYYSAPEFPKQIHPKLEEINIRENNWQQMSYSSLSAKMDLQPKENYLETKEDYERFVFKDLPKGAHTGNFIHFIFENISFNYPESWEIAIDKAISRFFPLKKEDEKFRENIAVFLYHIMHSDLKTFWGSLQLASVSSTKVLHELEFDFPVSLFSPKQLESIEGRRVLISNRFTQKKIEGMMTGFIDLFFEHNGKYYVLDWKSNYLGPSLENYSQEKLEKTMIENNYHLQHLIYSLAVKKYLKSRLGEDFDFNKKFGGVFYLFVRGMRQNSESGVYYYKPPLTTLTKWENLFSIQV